ncbi:hypothetical protein pb186bvf_004945 [Paramecium bursaria]
MKILYTRLFNNQSYDNIVQKIYYVNIDEAKNQLF